MVFTFRYILGIFLVIISNTSGSVRYSRNIQQPEAPLDNITTVPTTELPEGEYGKKLIIQNETVAKTEISNVETLPTTTLEPFSYTTDSIPIASVNTTIFETDIQTETNNSWNSRSNHSARTENARALDFDISKYTSPEFHNKNNVYNIPTSPENKKYADLEVIHKKDSYSDVDHSKLTYPFELTTPSNKYFDNKYKQVEQSIKQNLDDFFVSENVTNDNNKVSTVDDVLDKPKSSNDSKWSILRYSLNRNNTSTDKKSKSFESDLEDRLNINFQSAYNETSTYEITTEYTTTPYLLPESENKVANELEKVDDRFATTATTKKSRPRKLVHQNRTQEQTSSLDNYINEETIKSMSYKNKENGTEGTEIEMEPTTEEIVLLKRGSTKYVDTIASASSETESTSAKLPEGRSVTFSESLSNQLPNVSLKENKSIEQNAEENIIYPLINPVSVSTSTEEITTMKMYEMTEESTESELSSMTITTASDANTTPETFYEMTESILDTFLTTAETTTESIPIEIYNLTLVDTTTETTTEIGTTTSGITTEATTTTATTSSITTTTTTDSTTPETTVDELLSTKQDTLFTTIAGTSNNIAKGVESSGTTKPEVPFFESTTVPYTMSKTKSKENITSNQASFIPLPNPDIDDDTEESEEEYMEIQNKKVHEPIEEHGTPRPESTTSVFGAQTIKTVEAEISSTENEIVTEDGALGMEDDSNGGTIIAIIISTVGATCLILLAGLLFVMRRRQKRFNYGQRCTPVSLDAYSMDNVSVYNSVRRKAALRNSKRSYGNPAFDDSSVSNPLNFQQLMKYATNTDDIKDEFEEIPQVTARTNEMPEGCEVKNRYANVIPLPETRVVLSTTDDDPIESYINANYVTGPKGVRGYYIACQAPLQNTINDFWKMVWEQQSKVILMLTHLFENGVEKCVDYLPPSEVLDCHRLFGDYQVTLKKREVKEKYIISHLQLKNMVSNSWREVIHFWYSGWPEKGVPTEENSIIAFLIEARSYVKLVQNSIDVTHVEKRNGNLISPEVSPIVVHCSPGTGRTGAVIACDIAIREFELKRVVDIPKIVYRIRRDRASAVQTKDQYTFIYKVINLYATKLTGGALDSI